MRVWSYLALAATVAASLGGCLAPEPVRLDELALLPAAAPLLCIGAGDAGLNATNAVDAGKPLDSCNLRATVENGPGNEVTIAVNPTDPLNLVAGAKDYTFAATNGQCVWDGVYWTKDGGRTWGNANLPGSPWTLLTNPGEFRPAVTSGHWCITDPVVRFGADGTLYYAFLAYQTDPVTGSKTGNTTFPQGGFNDWLFTGVCMGVAVSGNGGESFDYLSLAACGSGPLLFHDKEWIAAEPSDANIVYMGWLTFTGVGESAGGLLRGATVAGGLTNLFVRSTDQGRTWEAPLVLAASGAGKEGLGYKVTRGGEPGQSTMIGADGEGNVYVTWQRGNLTYLTKSADFGETFEPPRAAVRMVVMPVPTTTAENAYRTPNQPFLAVDASGGERQGHLYLAWRDHRWGSADVAFARSTDGGATFSPPLRVNDDNGTAAQFFPALGVGANGTLHLAFVDRRYDAADYLLDLSYASSADGGATWSPNLRVTETGSDPLHSRHQNGMVFIGDYIDIAVSPRAAHPVWVDTRHGRADVYTAAVDLRAEFPT